MYEVNVCPRQCAPGRIRTCDTRFRRAVLYPLSYEGARPDYRAAGAGLSGASLVQTPRIKTRWIAQRKLRDRPALVSRGTPRVSHETGEKVQPYVRGRPARRRQRRSGGAEMAIAFCSACDRLVYIGARDSEECPVCSGPCRRRRR